jgi:hypothetical protein
MENGGDLSITDSEGNMPLQVQFGKYLDHWFEQYSSDLFQIIMAMMRATPDVTVRNIHGQTPLMILTNLDTRMYSLKDMKQ